MTSQRDDASRTPPASSLGQSTQGPGHGDSATPASSQRSASGGAADHGATQVTPQGTTAQGAIHTVAALIELLEASSLAELDFQHADLSLRLSRTSSLPQAYPAPAPAALTPITVATTTVCERPPAAPATMAASGMPVKSPLVGTAYLAPQPDHPPFVQVGDRVKTGQTLMIIEAMKVMNTIPAPKDGVVAEILVKNGQPVEYDEVLMRIE